MLDNLQPLYQALLQKKQMLSLQASAPSTDQAIRSAACFAADSACEPGNAALPGKKRKRVSAQPAIEDDSSLSKADVPQLLAMANEAKQGNPEAPAISKPESKQQLHKVVQKVRKAALVGQTQPASDLLCCKHQGAPPKVKTTKLPGNGSKLIATTYKKAESPGSVVSASDQASNDKAKASPDAAAVTAKQKKLGRNARLRLKRQAYRQQQQAATSQSPAETESATQIALPFTNASSKEQVAGSEDLPHKRQKPSQVSASEALPDIGDALASPAQPGATSVKKKQEDSVPIAPFAQSVGSPKALSRGKLKKKANLLEQMRSKLSGGRFRMLNEQLYTSAGQDAFQMMQGQPDLYQQYHEVGTHPTFWHVWFTLNESCWKACACMQWKILDVIAGILKSRNHYSLLLACCV